MKTEDFSEALQLAVRHSGMGILFDAPRLLALLGDYAPRLKCERDAIGMAFTLRITEQLADAIHSPQKEQEQLILESAAKISWELAPIDQDSVYMAISEYAHWLGFESATLSPLMVDPDPLPEPPFDLEPSFDFPEEYPDGNDRVVFARWAADGAYYPATVCGSASDGYVKVKFMDGVEELVETGDVVEENKALTTMKLWADWERRGGYYPCKIKSRPGEPMVVRYDADGVIEQVGISQLRTTLTALDKAKRLFHKK